MGKRRGAADTCALDKLLNVGSRTWGEGEGRGRARRSDAVGTLNDIAHVVMWSAATAAAAVVLSTVSTDSITTTAQSCFAVKPSRSSPPVSDGTA